jgi:hypothetical protein
MREIKLITNCERKPDVNKGSISEVQVTSKVPILIDTSLKID